MGSLELFGALHSSPWPEYRGGAAFAGLIPARARLASGEGGVERLEEVALYLVVASDGVGGGLRRPVHGRRQQAVALGRGGGAPEALGGGEGVGELHCAMEKVVAGSV